MRYLALLMVGLMSLPAFALTKVNLYQTEVVIDEQQDNADAAARINGMQQVIVRATGDKESVTNDVIQKALRQNSQYLNQISYGQQGDAKTIRMGFSGPHIRTLLTQAQLPFWPENRANLLVWLVEESNYDRSISWEHANTSLLNQLKASAQLRGLPITVPVGDFDDITGVQVSDLWGGFSQPISLASQRYPTDAVLVVRAQGSNLRWTLYDQNAANMIAAPKSPISGQASGNNAAADMVDELSDYYAKKNAVLVSSESSEAVLASFKPVNGAISFFTLEENLKRLSSVASLDILKIQGNNVTFKVHLLTSESEFEQEVLRMGRVEKGEAPIEPMQEPEVVLSNAVPVVDDAAVPAGETIEPPVQNPELMLTPAEAATEVPPETTPSEPTIHTLYFQWLG
ncbi:DUF2066 domain-containing protein [Vibrio fluvialis]|nr:DUF2066 domain-containing protein [Vibrio fluvialis]